MPPLRLAAIVPDADPEVSMVSFAVCTVFEPSALSVVGSKMQLTYAGTWPQDRVMVPVNPPTGINVMITVAACPAFRFTVDGVAVNEYAGAVTCWLIDADPMAKSGSPSYEAMTVYVPAVNADVV
jgi:hypothetical protein